MHYLRARLRYLAALGLPSLVIPMFSCSSGGTGVSTTPTSEPSSPVVTVPADTATQAPTATSTPSATSTAATPPTATPSATSSGSGSPTSGAVSAKTWVPTNDPRPKPAAGPRPIPRCPNGLVCTVAPASLGSATPAAAPYAACAEEASLPADAPAGVGLGVHTTFHAQTTAQERKTEPKACCYEWTRLCPGGRPLRGEEGGLVAEASARGDWLAVTGDLDLAALPADTRRDAAEHYLREAAFEHASIAAFSRQGLALLALGAPPDLVAATHEAALDEIEHARIAFALASALGGAARGPSALDLSTMKALPATLADLAVETFVDACAGETVAALGLREAASAPCDPAVAALLSRIAEDEERHAELAWRTVAWALAAGGAPVREALLAAAQSLTAEAHTSSAPLDDSPEALQAGLLGARAREACRLRALREVVLPCAEALLGAARGAQPEAQAPSLFV